MSKVSPQLTGRRLLAVLCLIVTGAFMLGAVGCSSEASSDEGPGLPAEPTAAQVVAAALTWIGQHDSTALGGRFSCFYEKGGETAILVNGNAMVSGGSLFLEVGGAVLSTEEVRLAPAQFVRVSAADFPDKASVERFGRALGFLHQPFVFDPLSLVRVMKVEESVERSADGSVTVEGVAEINDVWALFIGSQAVSWGEELGMLLPFIAHVTLRVDKDGRPLETIIARDEVTQDAFRWSWGVWRPADTQTVSVQELLNLVEEGM